MKLKNTRGSHAILESSSRNTKAQKIELIISRRAKLRGSFILDIGAGSGHIAEYFANFVGPSGHVIAIDRNNQLTAENVEFHQIESTQLPFESEFFDIVIYNHVIEHVGNKTDQIEHLQEIFRVLKKDGLLYLAMPNRWAPVEPHFKLPFLSWLPRPVRSPYVRSARKGEWYDCNPLTRREIQLLFDRCGLIAEEVTLEALQLMAERELPAYIGKPILLLPMSALKLTLGIIPTLVFLARKKMDKNEH